MDLPARWKFPALTLSNKMWKTRNVFISCSLRTFNVKTSDYKVSENIRFRDIGRATTII